VLFFARWAGAAGHPWLPVALGGAAVLGHMFSPYVSFKVAKASLRPRGCFWRSRRGRGHRHGCLVVCLWLTGYVSLSSIIAVASVPLWVALLQPNAYYVFWAGSASSR